MTTTRRYALSAGLLYYVTHVTSVVAVIAYGSVLSSGDLSGSNGRAALTGVVLELTLALACLGTGVLLLPILRPYGPVAAPAFAAMRTMEAAVIAAGTLPVVAAVWLATGYDDGAARPNSALLSTVGALHDAGFLVGQGMIISVNTVVLGWLLWRSGVVFRWIGMLGVVGGVLVLTGNLLQLFGAIPFGGSIAGVLAVPIFAFELWFASYLVFVGARARAA